MVDDLAWRGQLIALGGAEARVVLDHLDTALAEQADHHGIQLALRRFLGDGHRVLTELRSFAADPIALELLVRLAGASRYGTGIALFAPGVFWQVVQDREFREVWGRTRLAAGLVEHLRGINEPQARINVLVRYQQRHLLRIMLGDLAEDLGFEAIVNELSDLADVCIRGAVAEAAADMLRRYGPPPAALVVFALGKLGARELNYSSDIDLVCAYEEAPLKTPLPRPTGPGDKTLDVHDYLRRFAQRTIRLLDDVHPAGRLYRVDMRLRPEGESGELVLSRREICDYCWSVGRAWERQAWLKARPVTGPLAVGKRLLNDISPWIFPENLRWEELAEARAMRRRIEERGDDTDLKVGAGGIRDIEFLVQHHQLAFGGRFPSLRVRDTLTALDRLVERGLLDHEERDDLREAYLWLRKVEHRLQMWEARQLHALPVSETEQRLLAFRCGYHGDKALARFHADLDQYRARVRALAEAHYLSDTSERDAHHAFLASSEPDPALAELVLGAIAFRDRDKAVRRFQALAHEPFFVLSRSRTIHELTELLPGLLELLAQVPDPDATLAHFQHLVEAVGGRSAFYRALREQPGLLRRFGNLAGWAHFVVEHLHRHQGLADELVERLVVGAPSVAAIAAEAREVATGIDDPGPPLAFIQARELVATAVEDLDGAPTATTANRLSDLARGLLAGLVEHETRALAERWGRPLCHGRETAFCVLACGKLGGGEMAYASDLDVIFVCESGGHCPGADRGGEEFWLKVARNVIRRCDQARLYEIDPRLRPWGDQGELVVTDRALERYWQGDRDLWERLAMTRAVSVAGDRAFGARVWDLLHAHAIAAPVPGDAREQVRSMRRRLEDTVHGKDHLKRGPGGYVDIEFVAQFLSLGGGLPLAAGTDTVGQLDRAVAVGCLSPIARDELTAALTTLRRMEARARLYQGRAVSSIPNQLAERERFARAVGYADTAAMDLELHLARETARRWFDQVF